MSYFYALEAEPLSSLQEPVGQELSALHYCQGLVHNCSMATAEINKRIHCLGNH